MEHNDQGTTELGGDSSREQLEREVLADVRTYFEDQFGGEFTDTADQPDDVGMENGWFGSVRRLLSTRNRPEPSEQSPTASFITERWFDFSPVKGYDIEEHYWVKQPFAHVAILYNPEEKRRYYHVTEPILNRFEEHLRTTLVQVLRSGLMYQDIDLSGDRTTVFATQLRDVVNEYAATATPGTVHKLIYYLVRDFLDYAQIDPLMRDDRIEDISCDGEGVPVYVFHDTYRDLETNVIFDSSRLNSLTVRLAQMSNKQISVSNPLVDGTLPDGSRIQLTLGTDVAQRGSNFTIRNFSAVPLTPVDLINYETFSVAQMAYFWLAIENGKSLMFAGGTGSGKTTSMNSVSFFIPPDAKVVSIEDTLEITLPHENWIQSVTRESASATGQGEVSMYSLLQSSLRQRPEYILVGEIRTDPKVALTFFQAINTGHTAYTTFHSDSVEGVLSRLQNPPLEVPVQMLRELDIISIQKQVFLGRDRVRRNDAVAELGAGDDPNAVTPLFVFDRDASTDTLEQINDSHVTQEIAHERGWTDDELQDALDIREQILQYLIDNDITAYPEVAATIHTFARDPDSIVEQVRDDELDPSELPTEQ